jgi:hypothetical protein
MWCTFNHVPVRSNSSYDLAVTGVRGESMKRWSAELEPDVLATIEERALEFHAEVRALADLS